MKIGIVGDVHWSKYSSIIRSRGAKYSTRLENCIKSVNWAEDYLEQVGCELVVYLGDFFDSNSLSAEELSALNDISWNKIRHVFLVGNHEMALNDLSFSSEHVFNLCKNSEVIDRPTMEYTPEVNLSFIPYILDYNRENLSKYVIDENAIVFSHNDIKGIQLGKIISNSGFEIQEIESSCKLFINGHLHNGGSVTDKIINIGNLTGQNFSEDATKYEHRIAVLDTVTLSIDYIKNPYAFNFVKFDSSSNSVEEIKQCLKNISNVVCTIKINEDEKDKFSFINENTLLSRFIIKPNTVHNTSNEKAYESLSVNHLEKFKEYILNELGNSDSVVEEIMSIIN